MELEIINKLRDEAEKMDDYLSKMPESTPYERIKKAAYAARVDGFCASVDMVEEIVNENHEQMARDYGQAEDAHVAEE